MIEEQFAVPGHAFAIVGDAVQQNHSVAAEVPGMDVPALQLDSDRGGDADILEPVMVSLAGQLRDFLPMPQRIARDRETGCADRPPADGGQKKMKPACNHEALNAITTE